MVILHILIYNPLKKIQYYVCLTSCILSLGILVNLGYIRAREKKRVKKIRNMFRRQKNNHHRKLLTESTVDTLRRTAIHKQNSPLAEGNLPRSPAVTVPGSPIILM